MTDPSYYTHCCHLRRGDSGRQLGSGNQNYVRSICAGGVRAECLGLDSEWIIQAWKRQFIVLARLNQSLDRLVNEFGELKDIGSHEREGN